jgi:ZIP family zinc transporter
LGPGEIVLLGAVAGVTIFAGLPLGRLRAPAVGLRTFLSATATGILLFLVWDVLTNAVSPLDYALTAAQHGHGSWFRFGWLSVTFAACFSAGLLGLVAYDRWMARHRAPKVIRLSPGPGAAATTDIRAAGPMAGRFAEPAQRLSLLIAVGIGMHNFSEGLAIGQSAARGAVSLALLLIIGFGLHNATEGFGITAPLAASGSRPSWAMLGLFGLIGGGPTFLGTIVGQAVVNAYLSVAFLTLAAGSIVYVVVQLVGVAGKLGRRELLYLGITVGLLAGFATDFIVSAAGA